MKALHVFMVGVTVASEITFEGIPARLLLRQSEVRQVYLERNVDDHQTDLTNDSFETVGQKLNAGEINEGVYNFESGFNINHDDNNLLITNEVQDLSKQTITASSQELEEDKRSTENVNLLNPENSGTKAVVNIPITTAKAHIDSNDCTDDQLLLQTSLNQKPHLNDSPDTTGESVQVKTSLVPTLTESQPEESQQIPSLTIPIQQNEFIVSNYQQISDKNLHLQEKLLDQEVEQTYKEISNKENNFSQSIQETSQLSPQLEKNENLFHQLEKELNISLGYKQNKATTQQTQETAEQTALIQRIDQSVLPQKDIDLSHQQKVQQKVSQLKFSSQQVQQSLTENLHRVNKNGQYSEYSIQESHVHPQTDESDDLADTFEPLNLPSGATLLLRKVSGRFSCVDQPYGYYADLDNDCQVFHVCYPAQFSDSHTETYQYSFLCGEGSVFDQEKLACVEKNVATPCSEAPLFYFKNAEFGLPEERPIE